jgi:hypothetical protein
MMAMARQTDCHFFSDFGFLSNSWAMWSSRRTVLKMAGELRPQFLH